MINEQKMSLQDALKILGATGNETGAELSKIFKRASLRNHPDRGGSTEAMQLINKAYEMVSSGSGSHATTVADQRAKHAKDKKEFEENLEAYFTNVNSYFRNTFNAQDFVEYFTKYTLLPTTFTLDIKKRTSWVDVVYKFRSGDAYFDFNFVLRPPSGSGLSAPTSSSLGNVALSTFVLVGTKKHKMAVREYKWDKNPEKITPESLFPSTKLKSIFEPVKKEQKYKRADYFAAFNKLLNASHSGNDVRIPVGDYTITIYRNIMMRQGFWYLGGIYSKESKYRSTQRLSGALMEDEQGACLDMIVDTFKELQRLKPDDVQIANVLHKMCAEFSAGHRSATFVKRMADQGAKPEPVQKQKRQTSRVTKEDYYAGMKQVGASGSAISRYWSFDTGAGLTINIQRIIDNRKGIWRFTDVQMKYNGNTHYERVDIEIPETTDGSTLTLMTETLKALRGASSDQVAVKVLKDMFTNFKQGKFVAPHVQKVEMAKTANQSKQEFGSQPEKPTQAKQNAPDEAIKVQMSKDIDQMNKTIRNMISALVKAGRLDTPDKIKKAVGDAILLWK
ncbi:DnaJ domain-containing protein [Pectobacterium phage POP12]|nr:DnaJ domain-containing protein [Pectobacterium phage POP12]